MAYGMISIAYLLRAAGTAPKMTCSLVCCTNQPGTVIHSSAYRSYGTGSQQMSSSSLRQHSRGNHERLQSSAYAECAVE